MRRSVRGRADICERYLRADELIRAIREAAAGRRVIPASIASSLADHMPRLELSRREVEVLRLVSKGLRNKDIARVIGRATEP